MSNFHIHMPLPFGRQTHVFGCLVKSEKMKRTQGPMAATFQKISYRLYPNS